VRGNAFVQFTEPGDYQLHHGADDTTYTVIDGTVGGQTIAQNNCCPQDATTPFTIPAAGFYPFDFVWAQSRNLTWQSALPCYV
jgi:hypothetical protein